MSDLFLPRSVDNSYRGSRVALWLLALLALLKVAMGLNCIFNGQNVATSADGIPLDSFSPAAARVVVALFALSLPIERTGTPPGSLVNLLFLLLMALGLALSLWRRADPPSES